MYEAEGCGHGAGGKYGYDVIASELILCRTRMSQKWWRQSQSRRRRTAKQTAYHQSKLVHLRLAARYCRARLEVASEIRWSRQRQRRLKRTRPDCISNGIRMGRRSGRIQLQVINQGRIRW